MVGCGQGQDQVNRRIGALFMRVIGMRPRTPVVRAISCRHSQTSFSYHRVYLKAPSAVLIVHQQCLVRLTIFLTKVLDDSTAKVHQSDSSNCLEWTLLSNPTPKCSSLSTNTRDNQMQPCICSRSSMMPRLCCTKRSSRCWTERSS